MLTDSLGDGLSKHESSLKIYEEKGGKINVVKQ